MDFSETEAVLQEIDLESELGLTEISPLTYQET